MTAMLRVITVTVAAGPATPCALSATTEYAYVPFARPGSVNDCVATGSMATGNLVPPFEPRDTWRALAFVTSPETPMVSVTLEPVATAESWSVVVGGGA